MAREGESWYWENTEYRPKILLRVVGETGS
jgi:hypothetical protein